MASLEGWAWARCCLRRSWALRRRRLLDLAGFLAYRFIGDMVISCVEMPFSLRLEGNHAPFEAAARRKLLWLSRDDDNRLKMNRFHEGLDANPRRSWLNSRNGKIRFDFSRQGIRNSLMLCRYKGCSNIRA